MTELSGAQLLVTEPVRLELVAELEVAALRMQGLRLVELLPASLARL
jgi:hypothetical protein